MQPEGLWQRTHFPAFKPIPIPNSLRVKPGLPDLLSPISARQKKEKTPNQTKPDSSSRPDLLRGRLKPPLVLRLAHIHWVPPTMGSRGARPQTRWQGPRRRATTPTTQYRTSLGGRPVCPTWQGWRRRAAHGRRRSGFLSAPVTLGESTVPSGEGSQAQAPSEGTKVDRGNVLSAAVRPRDDKPVPEGQDPQDG